MLNKKMKTAARLALVPVAACAVCCAPFIGAFILGSAGVGGFAVGQWLIGGVLVIAAALYFIIRRRAKACGCATSSYNGEKHCG